MEETKTKSCEATVPFDLHTFGQEDDHDECATVFVYKDDRTNISFGRVCE